MKYRGILFDLDGVLCSTDRWHTAAWQKMCRAHGIPFPAEVAESLRGVSREESLAIILDAAGRSASSDERRAMAEEKNGYYTLSLDTLTPADADPAVRDTLTALTARGLGLAVASSSRNAPRILDRLGLRTCVDAVIDGSMLTHAKPHPEVFLKAAASLGLPTADCLVVEDAESGIAAARSAGIDCAYIGDVPSPDARWHIRTIPELLTLPGIAEDGDEKKKVGQT